MTPPEAAPMREDVTQADREAAAVVFDRRSREAANREVSLLNQHYAKVIRAGEGDDFDAVQSVAVCRRLAHTARPDAGDEVEDVDAAFAREVSEQIKTFAPSLSHTTDARHHLDRAQLAIWGLLRAHAACPDAGDDKAEIERLRQALQDVVNPIGALQRYAEAEGAKLSGAAHSIANDLGYLQGIARDALVATPARRPDAGDEDASSTYAARGATSKINQWVGRALETGRSSVDAGDEVERLIRELRNPWQDGPPNIERGPLPDWAGGLLDRAAAALAAMREGVDRGMVERERLALEDAAALERTADEEDENGWLDWAATTRQAAKRFRSALSRKEPIR
jgi:hypothetical protein